MADEDQLPEIDFRQLFGDLKRYSGTAVLVWAATSSLILFPILNQKPKYTSAAAVMLDARSYKDTPGEDVVSNLPSDTTQMDTEVEVLKSTQLAKAVIAKLQLDKDPEFNPFLQAPQSPQPPKQNGFSLFPKKDLSQVEERFREEQIVQNVLENLSVKRQGLTRVINVSFKSLNADKSARIANEWLNEYLSQQIEAKISGTQKANALVGARLSELKTQVEEANNSVEAYKLANGILSADGKDLTAQEISNYSQQVTSAKAAVAEAQARLDTARQQMARGSHGDDLGEALNSEVIQNLRRLRAEVSKDYTQLNSRYGPKHPEIIRVKSQLADIDTQIASEIQRIVANLATQAQVQKQRLDSLQASLNSAESKLRANNLASAKLNELQTNAESIRALYESYLNKYKETGAAEGNAKADARIVSSANLPTSPSEPKIPLGIAISLLAGGFAAFLSMLLRKMFDRGINYLDDVETKFNQQLVASIPTVNSTLKAFEKFEGTPMDFIKKKPLSVFAESFRNLRASLIYSSSGDPVKVVAVTSAIPGEGKTTTSLCLAQTAAMSGQKVIVLDCDLRRHTISSAIVKQSEKGLLEYINSEATLDEVVLTDKTGVSYIPLSKGSYTARDVFGTDAMDKVLNELRSKYDLVVLDTAPVIPVVDSRILSRKADATILLAKWRGTAQDIIKQALNILTDSGAKVSGVAITQLNMKQTSAYSYGNYKYYGKAYGNYFK